MHTLLRQVADRQGYVMAIDTARAVLHSAGILGGREPGSDSGSERKGSGRPALAWRSESSLSGGLAELPSERVRVEGRVILSQGSDSAEEAALTLASMLES